MAAKGGAGEELMQTVSEVRPAGDVAGYHQTRKWGRRGDTY